MHKHFGIAALLAFAITTPAPAQTLSAPTATPVVRTIPDAVDTTYPGGTMRLDIDATDVQRGVYRVTQTIPVAPGTGSLVLLFPQWLPGTHGSRGPIAELADVRFTVDGKSVAWRRDPLEVYALRLDLPKGARQVVARFVHTSPLQTSEGRITMTSEMLNLQWEKMSLYPAGHYVRQIRVRPSVTFPAGWTAATALDGQSAAGGKVTWAETNYEVLVDSPIFAGKHYRKLDLGNRVTMHTVADTPDLLALKPEHEPKLRAMVAEAIAAFGSRAFDRYEFLVALTDRMGSIGLEHHRSSENQLEPKTFVDWEAMDWDRNVLAHELAHSWNGKFRRPAGLWTPDYREPMRGTLLWVYEGQTQFWGNVIAARSGLQTKETVLGAIAASAGNYAEQPGRGWRSVEDTTYDPIFAS
jgi:predicted metalloprotease with PDZ domain